MDEAAAIAYLAQPKHSFWHWEDRAQVAAWTDGGTLAFRPEIEAVLRALAGEGLPPLDSVLLLLAACQQGWDKTDRGMLAGLTQFHESQMSAAGVSWRLLQQVRGPSEAAQSLLTRMAKSDRPLTVLLEVVLAGLDAVHALPPERRSKVEAKAALARMVFETVRVRQDAATSDLVLRAIRAGVPPELLEPSGAAGEMLPGVQSFYPPHPTRRFVDCLAALFQGLSAAPLGRQSVDLRLRTGLAELPSAAPGETPAGRSVQDLLEQMAMDQELSGLAKLARDLMAVVYLPRHVSDPEELPVGGFSDISNRGSPDRLLPGELAHDDLTLSVRIALNEALYFRRERPPRNPVSRRRLLIDTGIRMWGVPRVFGAAVALAMAATGESHAKILAFSAAGEQARPIDLASREGLTQLLESLEVEAHPGKALAKFLAEEAGEDEVTDNLLITHPDVLADRDFRRAAADLCEQPLYVAAVDRDGAYRLERWTRMGRSVLREAKMDLSSLFKGAGPKRAAALLDDSYDPAMPVILATRPFPLLLQHPIDAKQAVFHEHTGVLSVSHDRRLMLWRQRGRAALQLSDSLPRGSVCWLGLRSDRAYVLMRSNGGLALGESNLEGTSFRARILPLGVAQPRSVCLLGDRLCLVYPGMVAVTSVETGQMLEKVPVPQGVEWKRGHVFVQELYLRRDKRTAWHVLAATATGAALREVPLDPQFSGDVLAVFEREGVEGLWAVFSTGEIVLLDGDHPARPTVVAAAQFASVNISKDGHRLALTPISGGAHLHRDLRKGTSYRLASAMVRGVPWEYTSDASGGLRRNLGKVASLAVQEPGRVLCLGLTGADRYLRFELHGNNLRLTTVPRSASMRTVAGFVTPRSRRDVGYQLRLAESADGSKAWLDSRGLIHLKSSDPSAPEVSLVLVGEGATAGWASDGTWCGPAYFVGDHATVDAEEFYRHVERFLSHLA